MAIRRICVYPEPVLRSRCSNVEEFDGELAELIRDMVETMVAAPGVGLAAPQVGVEQRVAVVDVSVGEQPDALHVLINPEIVEEEGRDVDVEGCLSIPDLTEKVERPERIVVSALDAEGEPYRLEARGLLARAICHEVDHLNGILFVDHLRGLRKERARRQLKRLKRSYSETESWGQVETAS